MSERLIGDRYRLQRLVGTGGMGAVWLAHDERLGRDVAVKLLHAPVVLDADEAAVAAARAMREARITARLHHPHAVPVFDVVEHEGRPCLVMQYYPSASLAELAHGPEPLQVRAVARIGGEVASALAAAHGLGIVHRDVKPANVLVGADGTAKISDFGIAHALDDASLTSTGMVTGTPAYLAPEVARGEPATPSSDVFSLGSTLYTALEARTPFGQHENAMAVLHRVATGQVDPPERTGALTTLLLTMLAPDPADRPTMDEVARRLLSDGDARESEDPATGTPAVLVPVAAPAGVDEDDEDPLAAFRQDVAHDGPSPTGGRPGRGRRLLLAVVALAAAALVVSLGLQQAAERDTADAPPAGSASPTARPSSATPTPTPSPSTAPPAPTPRPSSSAPAPSPSPKPTTTRDGRPPTTAELAKGLRDYYALVPDDLDAGWERLTDRYRRTTAGSRGSYAEFWGAFERVSVSDVAATAPDRVTATLRYEAKDGRVDVERTTFRLVRDDGVLKIDGSEVLSSTRG